MVLFQGARGASTISWVDGLPGGRRLLAFGEMHYNNGNGKDLLAYLRRVSKQNCVDVYLEKARYWTWPSQLRQTGRGSDRPGLLQSMRWYAESSTDQYNIRWHSIDVRDATTSTGAYIPLDKLRAVFNSREYFAFMTGETQVLRDGDRSLGKMARAYQKIITRFAYKHVRAVRMRFEKQRKRFYRTLPALARKRVRNQVRLWCGQEPDYTKVTDLFMFYRMFGTFDSKRKYGQCPQTQNTLVYIAGDKHVQNLLELIRRIFGVSTSKRFGYEHEQLHRRLETLPSATSTEFNETRRALQLDFSKRLDRDLRAYKKAHRRQTMFF